MIESLALEKTDGDRRQMIKLPTRTAMVHAAAIAAAIIFIILLWQQAASRNWVNGQLFGSPLGILLAAKYGLTQGTLISDTLTTLYETPHGPRHRQRSRHRARPVVVVPADRLQRRRRSVGGAGTAFRKSHSAR